MGGLLLRHHRRLRGSPATLTERGITIRRAEALEAGAIAELYLRSFRTALPTVRLSHDDDAVHAWFRDDVVRGKTGCETWVADQAGGLVGLLVLREGWIEQLYLAPEHQRAGIGSRLVALAKELRPNGLDLYTFQVNRPARAFYEKHGFLEVTRGDGSGNEEREPDIHYAWRP